MRTPALELKYARLLFARANEGLHCRRRNTPGNSPKEWRMMLYSDLARGVNIVNLFDFW